MSRALHASLIAAVLLFAACGSPKKHAAAEEAANTYCQCVERAVEPPLTEASSVSCKDERMAFDTAWKELAADAEDKKADEILKHKQECSELLSLRRTAESQVGAK